MPTVIGLLFFVASIYLLFRRDDTLFALVIFSAIFQASSVVALNDAGIEPYYPVAALFVLQGIYRGKSGILSLAPFKGKLWMILFASIAISSSLILPFVFAGIPVYEQHVGIDDGLFIRPPLQFTHANISHSLSLLLGVLVVLESAQRTRSWRLTRKAYMFTFYFLAATIFLQFFCSLVGWEFPYALLQNHAGGSMQHVDAGDISSRYPGTFSESSGAGQLLAAFTAGFLAENLRLARSLIPALVGFGAIILVRSSGSIVAIGLVLTLLIVWQPFSRFPYINTVRLTRAVLLAGIVSVVLAVVLFSSLRDSLIGMTVDKGDTASFVNRTASDMYAIDLFVRTHGIGVGMGSNRPSSLITSLLSTVGILGFVTFLFAYFKLLSNAAPAHRAWQWVGLTYFLALSTSGPDYDAPLIWIILAVAVQMGRATEGAKMPIGGVPRALSGSRPA